MLNDLLDGLAASLGFGRSMLQKRAERLSFGRQTCAFVFGVIFFGVTTILLFWARASFLTNISFWVEIPVAILAMYFLFELGLWFGLVLVEPKGGAGDSNSES